jgi:hypothetical protein
MNTVNVLPERIVAMVAQVRLAADGRRGVVCGSPAVLAALCAYLGFRNTCSKGSVFLTDAKLRFLGLEVR